MPPSSRAAALAGPERCDRRRWSAAHLPYRVRRVVAPQRPTRARRRPARAPTSRPLPRCVLRVGGRGRPVRPPPAARRGAGRRDGRRRGGAAKNCSVMPRAGTRPATPVSRTFGPDLRAASRTIRRGQAWRPRSARHRPQLRDPSAPANPYDSVYRVRAVAGRRARAMSGRTETVVGRGGRRVVDLPMGVAVSRRNQVDPHGRPGGWRCRSPPASPVRFGRDGLEARHRL